jgi:Alkylmercury lyase
MPDETIHDEDVRVAVYRRYAETGLEPTVAWLARELGTNEKAVRPRLRRLAEQRLVVLGPDERILMAHPFTSIPMGFAVMGDHTLWWGGCAWDSFALPHLVPGEPAVLVSTTCPNCRRPLAWTVGREKPPPGREVAHFLTPAAHMWDDVIRTCSNQRIFCDSACVDTWVTQEGLERGYVMDLATLWRLAAGWYAGRLETGYSRREPAVAADYFREVGLDGPFWGLS